MKRIAAVLPFALILFLAGCDHGHDYGTPVYDDYAPFPPVGITTVSLDNAIELKWIANQESDLSGYNIYVSPTYNGRYQLIGSSHAPRFTDAGARNGTTMYYAVTAFDYSGNESELSRDVAYDTPRPEGLDVPLTDRYRDPFRAGYDFSMYRILHYDTEQTDFFTEYSGTGIAYLVVWKDTDIQDMGYTKNLDEISAAPEGGWSPTQDAVAIPGHTYVVWTYDNHFAKIRVTSVTSTGILFDWAYQTATGNPELFRHDRSGLEKRGDAAFRRRH